MKRTRCSPNLESRNHCWSGPHVECQTRFSRIASVVCFASTLWISGVTAPSSTIAGTLDDVRARGTLICGVSEGLPGFSEKDGSGVWRGFDVDFCKAIAAAVFGDVAKVEYRPLSAEARFDALKSRRIDLLSRNSTWTMSRELELGLEFAGVSYFDGQGFLLPALYGATSPLQLGGAKICVATGTTSEKKCDAFTGDRSGLAAERSSLPSPEDHVILRDIISTEPLGPVTRDDDSRWTSLVRWTLFALINAEELGINSKSVSAEKGQQAVALGAPAARSLGLSRDWLVKLIGSVGNYGEIFERNLGPDTPLKLNRGMNALWNEGGLLYAPPMQ
jgi:general L-amino acid transport system substrate-binding protein